MASFIHELSTYLKKISNFFQLNGNDSDIIAYVFGLVAAVFTLVGLLAIFVSINSQHNIQKCRELLWNLRVEEKPEKIIKDIELYRSIVKDKSEFTGKVIGISTFSIRSAILIILFLNISLLKAFQANEWIFILVISMPMIIVLYSFSILLSKLKNITEISNLPTLSELLNAKDESHGVNAIRIASKVMNFHIIMYQENLEEENTPSFGFAVNSPFHFQNLIIKLPTMFKISSFNHYGKTNIELEAIFPLEKLTLNQNGIFFGELPLKNFKSFRAKIPGYYYSDYWYVTKYEILNNRTNDEDTKFQINMHEYDIYQMRIHDPLYESGTDIIKGFESEIFLDTSEITLLNSSYQHYASLGIKFDGRSEEDDGYHWFNSKFQFNPIKTSEEKIDFLGHAPISQFLKGEYMSFPQKKAEESKGKKGKIKQTVDKVFFFLKRACK